MLNLRKRHGRQAGACTWGRLDVWTFGARKAAMDGWSAKGREKTRKTRKESHSSTARGSQERLAKARRVREGRLSRLSRRFVGFVIQTLLRSKRDRRLDRDRPRKDAKNAKGVALEYRSWLPGAARLS